MYQQYKSAKRLAPLRTPTSCPNTPADEERSTGHNLEDVDELVPNKNCTSTMGNVQAIWDSVTKSYISREEELRREILSGRMDVECPATAKVVRIFTSSTFTDTSQERNALMTRVYPKLRTFCREKGYEFQVVDMRWGVRDEATDNHMTTELCLREIKRCQKISTGPNFVTFLSHKYGYRAVPRTIEATEFEKLLESVKDKDDIACISRWFRRDDNAVPPCYILQPISTNIPDFLANEVVKRDMAKQMWNKESERLRQVLSKSAKQILTGKDLAKYVVSVTEAEIAAGILEAKDVNRHCVWFKRIIKDIERQEMTPVLAKYIDCSESVEVEREHRQLLNDLTAEKLPTILSTQQIHQHEIDWSEKGVDPDSQYQHKIYIDNLCQEFESTMKQIISTGIEDRRLTDERDDVCEEVIQHAMFGQKKCQCFHGRTDILEKIKQYILGRSKSPLVVYGQSGAGKTSIVAMAAKHTKTWLQGKGLVVLRFVGTTQKSTGIVDLLTSIVNQILVVKKETWKTPKDLKDLTEQFSKALQKASSHNPFFILLDSLDQLNPSDGARQLAWLPKQLPPFVKIVVSTLPESQYDCFPRLRALMKDSQQFLGIPTLPDSDVTSILDSWLALNNRKLTNHQLQLLLDTFSQCPIPLFLKLSFDEACRWTSYESAETTAMETTVRAGINRLLERVEQMHGQRFVSRALGYLTLVKNGLTESELEDILSCDDDVLNDVYQYWTPPVRRLPPLLIVRMKADLGSYLVDRGADGIRVLYWYHRQFTEAAQDRYCNDKEESKTMNIALADFFRAKWFGVPKPFIDKNGRYVQLERYVAAQPLQFSGLYNVRKMNNLPRHLILGNQLDVLKKDVCLNLEFLLAKLKATSIRAVLDDFDFAREYFPDDPDIKLVQEALQLSQDALVYDPNQLPGQLLGRMPIDKESILSNPKSLAIRYLIPDKKILNPAGGQLAHCLGEHTQLINCVDISSDGTFAASAADDNSVRTWDVRTGKSLMVFENILEEPERIQICAGNKMVIVASERKVLGLTLSTGETDYTITNLVGKDSCVNFVTCGEIKDILVVASGKNFFVYNAITGRNTLEIINNERMDEDFGIDDPISAQGTIVATAIQGSGILRVADIASEAFTHNKRVFPEAEDRAKDEIGIDALAITPDGKLVVFASSKDNDVHICDLQTLSQLRVVKGRKSDAVDEFHITPDGSTLYFPNGRVMTCIDLASGQRYNQLKHQSEIFDVVTVDMRTVVSVAEDSVVRIWNLTRDDLPTTKKVGRETRSSNSANSYNTDDTGKRNQGKSDGRKKGKKFKFRMLKPLPNHRYVMAYTSVDEVQIYDIMEKKVVRKGQIPAKRTYHFNVVDTKTAVVTTADRKMKLVDLDRMVVSQVFQGVLPKYKTDLVIRRNAKEILTLSRGCKNIKIYSMETGLTTAVLKVEGAPKMDEMVLSQDEKWLAVSTKGFTRWIGGNLFMFDIGQRTCHFNLTTTYIGGHFTPADSTFTPCGSYLLLNTAREYPGFGSDDVEWYFLVINTETGKILHHLLDVEYFKKYKSSDSIQQMSVGSSTHAYLRDSLFLVGSCDCLIRVWDISTGELLHRLSGHTIDVSELKASDDGARFVSHSSYSEEGAFRLWDGHTFECLASFKGDNEITKLFITSDGRLVVAGDESSRELVTWRLEGDGREVQSREPPGDVAIGGEQTTLNMEEGRDRESSGEVQFQGEQTKLTLSLDEGDDKEFQEEDPDTDEEEMFWSPGPNYADDGEQSDEEDTDDVDEESDELSDFETKSRDCVVNDDDDDDD